jgi:hypothetical protein
MDGIARKCQLLGCKPADYRTPGSVWAPFGIFVYFGSKISENGQSDQTKPDKPLYYCELKS